MPRIVDMDEISLDSDDSIKFIDLGDKITTTKKDAAELRQIGTKFGDLTDD